MENLKAEYHRPLALTSQFRFCGNPFRLDFYSFCSFGCKYCFARNINGQEDFEYKYADFDIVKKEFEQAFESDEDTKKINVELLRHKVPIHVGGLADPFQPIEFRLKLNYKLIELSNKYQYPLIFSTKQCYLPEEYYEILDPTLHAFQISLIGLNENYIRKYEENTPTAKQRIEFLKELRRRGFWCSIRIQPIIDVNEVINLCKEIDGIASYITLEHLKISTDNPTIKELFNDEIHKYKRTSIMRNLELPADEKKKNIDKIKQHLKFTKVGVGDNDLHYLSESRCCCGIDTINDNFDNYLKYNLTYFTTEHLGENIDVEKIWVPQSNVNNSVNGDIRIKGHHTIKDYTDQYCSKFNEFMCEGCSMKNKLNGIGFVKNTGMKYKEITIFNLDEKD